MFRRLTLAALAAAAVLAPLAARAAIIPDNTYGTAGRATVAQDCTGGYYGAIPAAGYGGRVYVAEDCAAGYKRVFAVDNSGHLDPNYGTAGHVTFKIPAPCRGSYPKLVPARDGSAYVLYSGYSTPMGSTVETNLHVCAVRITPGGTLVSTFGGSSPVRRLERLSDQLNYLSGGAVDDHGRLLVFTWRAGSDWPYSAAFVNRYTTSGRPDPTFSSDGQVAYKQRYFDSLQWGGVVGDKPVIAVSTRARPDSEVQVNTTFVRFTNGGELDPTFAGDGKLLIRSTDLGGGSILGYSIAVDDHKRIAYVVKDSDQYHSGLWLDLRRIGPTGKNDAAFAAATAKIRPPSQHKIDAPKLQVSASKYLVLWQYVPASNTPDRVTGFNGDGTRWAALGTNGTTAHTVAQFAPDRAAFYEWDDLGLDTGNVTEIFRRLVE